MFFSVGGNIVQKGNFLLDFSNGVVTPTETSGDIKIIGGVPLSTVSIQWSMEVNSPASVGYVAYSQFSSAEITDSLTSNQNGILTKNGSGTVTLDAQGSYVISFNCVVEGQGGTDYALLQMTSNDVEGTIVIDNRFEFQ